MSVQRPAVVEAYEEVLAVGVGVDERQSSEVATGQPRVAHLGPLDAITGEPVGDLVGEASQRVAFRHTAIVRATCGGRRGATVRA